MRPSMWAGVAVALVASALVWLLLGRSWPPDVATSPRTDPDAQRGAPTLQGRPANAPAPGPATEPLPSPAAAAAAAVETAKPKLRIWGRVLDESGVGLGGAGVEVRAWSGGEWSTVSLIAGPDGAFEAVIDRSRAVAGFGVAASADGHVEGWRALKPEEYDEARGIDVVVDWARAVSGRVVDAEDRAIPGTTVQLWYGSESTWPTTADADGRFRTLARAPRRAFELVVEAPGYVRRTIAVPAGTNDPTEVGDVVFRRRARVSGFVVDADGRPVQDLPLVIDQVAGKTPAPRTRTDSGGRFELQDVGGDRVTILVDAIANGGGSTERRRRYRGSVGDVEVGREDVRLVVHAQTAVTLRFVDAGGRDPVDLKSALYGLRHAGTPEPVRLIHGAMSEPLLSVTLSVESGGRFDFMVRARGFDDGHLDGVQVGDVDVLELSVPMRPSR